MASQCSLHRTAKSSNQGLIWDRKFHFHVLHGEKHVGTDELVSSFFKFAVWYFCTLSWMFCVKDEQ